MLTSRFEKNPIFNSARLNFFLKFPRNILMMEGQKRAKNLLMQFPSKRKQQGTAAV